MNDWNDEKQTIDARPHCAHGVTKKGPRCTPSCGWPAKKAAKPVTPQVAALPGMTPLGIKPTKAEPIMVYLESSMVLNRKTWHWVRASDNKIELLGYESAQDALDGLTQANLVMGGRYVACATPAKGANMKDAKASCECRYYQGATCAKCAGAHTPVPWNVVLIREDRKGWNLSADAYKDWPAAIAYKIKDEALEIGCDEAEANARLISAAPDLLRALERLAEMSQWSVSSGVNETAQMRANFNHAIEAAHAAILRATEGK